MTFAPVCSPLLPRSSWPTEIYKKSFLNQEILKLIAMIAMLLDNIGVIFLSPSTNAYLFCRFIGRLSFPIFAFLLTEGYIHTSNKAKYLKNLLIFAFISEIPFDIAFHEHAFNINFQNIFFELATGLFALYIYDSINKKSGRFYAIASVIILALIADYCGFDYGFIGILIIIVFYLFRTHLSLKLTLFVFLTIFFFYQKYSITYGETFALQHLIGSLNPYLIFSAIPILHYNGKKSDKQYINKYFFYAFYPLHIVVLFLIKTLCT